MPSSSMGILGFSSRGGIGLECSTASSVISELLPVNGFFPVAISYSTMPKENRSLRASMVSLRACSGDM